MLELNMSNWHESYINPLIAAIFLLVTIWLEVGLYVGCSYLLESEGKTLSRAQTVSIIVVGNFLTWIIGFIVLAALGFI